MKYNETSNKEKDKSCIYFTIKISPRWVLKCAQKFSSNKQKQQKCSVWRKDKHVKSGTQDYVPQVVQLPLYIDVLKPLLEVFQLLRLPLNMVQKNLYV